MNRRNDSFVSPLAEQRTVRVLTKRRKFRFNLSVASLHTALVEWPSSPCVHGAGIVAALCLGFGSDRAENLGTHVIQLSFFVPSQPGDDAQSQFVSKLASMTADPVSGEPERVTRSLVFMEKKR